MKRTLVVETLEKVGEKVELCGWVQTVRDHGKITFFDLWDRSGLVQVIGQNLPKLSPQDVVSLVGLVKKRPEKLVNSKIATGEIEIEVINLEILSKSQELPFDMGMESLNLELPTLLDWRALTLRHPKIKAIFKVQEVVIDSFRETLKRKDFFEFQAPILIPEIAEGGSEVFKVPYFGHEVYLSQSPQLYKQILVGVYERVFAVNKTLRAEPSVTTRHLTEVTTLDAEFGFIDSWMDVKEMAEYTIKNILNEVEKKCGDILKMYDISIPQVSETIPMIKLREAQEIIYQRTGRDNRNEPDMQPEDEREICKWSKEEKGSDLVFISHYPVSKRPFYTYSDPDDPDFTMSFDLIGRGTEWLTGGRRINDYELLVEMAKKRKVDPEKLGLYLQAFKFGMPPEGGFSFGSERITMHILGLANVREASLFPRDMERVDIRLSTQPISRVKNNIDVYKTLLELLNSNNILYKKYEHEPVFTSEDSAMIRGTTVHQGAKALVLDSDKGLILFVLPADLKADLDFLKTKGEFSKLKMVSKETVKAKVGLEVGAIPPFGSLIDLKTYVDSRLSENDEIAFNAGRHDKSVKMKYSDFVRLENPVVLKSK